METGQPGQPEQFISFTGVARANHNSSIATRRHDVGLVLAVTEYSKDGYERGATEIDYTIRPSEIPGRGIMTYRDNGSGEADEKRILSPSTENGATESSRYGQGKQMTRNYLSDNTFPHTIAWKEITETSADGFKGPYTSRGMKKLNRVKLPSQEYPEIPFGKDDHGYFEQYEVLEERLPQVANLDRKVKKNKKNDVAPESPKFLDSVSCKIYTDSIKEITRVRFPQEMLNRTTTRIKATGINGNIHEDIIPSGTKTLVTVLDESPFVERYPTKTIEFETFTAVVKYYKTDKSDKSLQKEFPNYFKGGCALVALRNQIVADLPIHELLGLGQHPASQNNRIMYINFDYKPGDTNIDNLPTPASVKIKFVGGKWNQFVDEIQKLDYYRDFIKWKKRGTSETTSIQDTQSVSLSEEDSENDDETISVVRVETPRPTTPPSTTVKRKANIVRSIKTSQNNSANLVTENTQTTTVPVVNNIQSTTVQPVVETNYDHDVEPSQTTTTFTPITETSPTVRPSPLCLNIDCLWIEKLVGDKNNLKIYRTLEDGKYKVIYEKIITDADQCVIVLAVAITEWSVKNNVPIEEIDISWSVTGNKYRVITDSINKYSRLQPVLSRVNVIAKN